MSALALVQEWSKAAFGEMSWEQASYIGTVLTCGVSLVAIPAYIWLHFRNEAKERLAEQQEIDDDLVELYLRVTDHFINSPHLDRHDTPLAKDEDIRAQRNIYDQFIILFERAFLRLHDEKGEEYEEMWASWEDLIYQWLERANFRAALPELMKGENGAFVSYIQGIVGPDYKKNPGRQRADAAPAEHRL